MHRGARPGRPKEQTMIDYTAQFKLVTDETAAEMTRTWKNHRTYLNAKQAFTSAQRTENRGTDVAFAVTNDGVFHVWSVMLEEVDGCSDCGYLWPMSDLTDLTREGYDPCKIFICPDCNIKAHTCERCQEQCDRTTNAIPGDYNSAYWCDACIADPKAQAQIVLCAYEQAVEELEYATANEERQKYIDQAQGAIDDMAPALYEALKKVVG
jgi:hypothetical protein